MRTNHRSTEHLAKGWHSAADRQGTRRLNLYVSDAVFERIREMAAEYELGMSACARELVCDGLATRARGQR